MPFAGYSSRQTPESTRAQVMAGKVPLLDFVYGWCAVIASLLIAAGWHVKDLFLCFALANMVAAVYICRLLLIICLNCIAVLFKILYRVEVRGLRMPKKLASVP